MFRHAGKSATVIIECLKTPFKAIVQYANQGIVAEADRLITGGLKHLGQVRPVWPQGLVGLKDLVGSGWSEFEFDSQARNGLPKPPPSEESAGDEAEVVN